MKISNQTKLSELIDEYIHENTKENDPLRNLSSEDIYRLIHIMWTVASNQLKFGRRVIFDGWLSVFTKPIKRETYDSKVDNTRKMTYAHRLRFRPLTEFRLESETDLTKSEYDKLTKK